VQFTNEIMTDQTITLGLIEDQKLARVGIITILQDYPGLRIIGEAETGKAGLELAETQRPQVMVVDLGLPDMDGIELIRELKRLRPEMIIVVLTVHDQERCILDALVAGASSYCLKENISSHLGDVIKSTCRGGAWLDQQAAAQVVQLLATHQSAAYAKGEGVATIPGKPGLLNMTEREQKVLSLLAEGKSNTEIALALNVSYHTVKSDMTQLMMKLGVQDRTQAVIKAFKEHLV